MWSPLLPLISLPRKKHCLEVGTSLRPSTQSVFRSVSTEPAASALSLPPSGSAVCRGKDLQACSSGWGAGQDGSLAFPIYLWGFFPKGLGKDAPWLIGFQNGWIWDFREAKCAPPFFYCVCSLTRGACRWRWCMPVRPGTASRLPCGALHGLYHFLLLSTRCSRVICGGAHGRKGCAQPGDARG